MAVTMPSAGADALLEGLDDAQREAVRATTGPVAILAGAGSGKTRVIAHRVAYAVATGAVAPRSVLLVTFTEKAATEMIERVAGLGMRGVAARTFHSAALAQLRHFWPPRHDGRPLPEILAAKGRIVGPLARSLPGGYRFTPAKDLIDEIEWAKSRRLTPDGYAGAPEVASGARVPPTTLELFVRLYRDYERTKARQGFIDFDDMLTLTVELLETDSEAAALVRSRYAWFSVDEYQDTSPLQDRLLELWLGERRDICVVGDEDQTIYTFTGATPAFLTGFAERFSGARVIELTANFRSSPEIIALANRLIASTGRSKRLTATRPSGPKPGVHAFTDGDSELDGIVREVARLRDAGVTPREMAVLVRLNAQIPPLEEALRRAGVPYRVRGTRFYDRREVRSAIGLIERAPSEPTGSALAAWIGERWRTELGFDPAVEPDGAEARERHAALGALLTIVWDLLRAQPAATAADVASALGERAAAERSGSQDGVELLTLHRAKGLEWDAVFLPMLEEGSLPVHHARDDPAAIDEERRLLYVGITRARTHLWLSWARRRTSPQGKESTRRMSRFVEALDPAPAKRRTPGPTPGGSGIIPGGAVASGGGSRARDRGAEGTLMTALRAWRTARARADAVPAYVVASDATLAEVAERRPRTLAALRPVPGIGPAKLDRYGEEMLGVISAAGDDP